MADELQLRPVPGGVTNPSYDDGGDGAAGRPPVTSPDVATAPDGHGIPADHPTSYLETVMHIFKGNVGPGLYAMGDAFRNGGLLLSPVLTLLLGVISVHSEHILLQCSARMHRKLQLPAMPDFADTVGHAFAQGHPSGRRWASLMRRAVNFFICITQLGLCCVYFVFISTNLKQICDAYDVRLDVHLHMLLILIPVMLPALITNLKLLAWFMTAGNTAMILGIGITFYYATRELPPVTERTYVGTWRTLPLYFGTAIFAFEGIALVLPLQNAMRVPRDFSRPFGVLNVGMTVVTLLFTATGFLGYLRWGDTVQGSLTLNLPPDEPLAQCVKAMISAGILCGYALQFFIAIQIMLPDVQVRFDPDRRHPVRLEMIFRIVMVLVTFLIAEGVPNLGAFISLIGALCSTSLALVFPPAIELALGADIEGTGDGWRGPEPTVWCKNLLILGLAFAGFLTGTYESAAALLRSF